jgi:hypothetical protein
MRHPLAAGCHPSPQIIYNAIYNLPILSSEAEDWRDWLYLLTLSAAVIRRD